VTDAEVEIFFLKWSQVGGSNRVIIFAKIDKKSTLAKFENRPNNFKMVHKFKMFDNFKCLTN
jgi:hypothetical protein